MKYLVKRNIKNFFLKKNITVPLFFCIFIYYLYSSTSDISTFDLSKLFYILTGTINSNKTFLITSLSFIINYIFIYYSIMIYRNDLSSKNIIFLRISYKHWIVSLLLSVALINLILLILIYFVASLGNIIVFNETISINISVFILIYFSKIILQFVIIFILKIMRRFSILFISVIFMLIYFFNAYSVIFVDGIIDKYGNLFVLVIQIVSIIFLVVVNFKVKDRNLVM